MPERPLHKWTVEIEISETLVEDGFDLTDERMHAIMAKHLPYAYGRDIRCKVLTRPDDEMAAETVEAYLDRRRR